MRNRRVLVVLGAILVALLVVGLTACGEKPIDVVNGQRPVSTLYERIDRDLEILAQLPPGEREAYLRKSWPHLETGVVDFIRRNRRIGGHDRVDNVTFLFGSMSNIAADGGDDYVRRGYFRDQIVAKIRVDGIQEPILVIVQCLNGLYVIEGSVDAAGLQQLGTYAPVERFVIGKGEGLVHHVDFPTAIALAERHRLPLYRGRSMQDSREITPAQARALENRTDWVQVTVLVVEGDEFDLVRGTFTPSPLRTRRRQ